MALGMKHGFYSASGGADIITDGLVFAVDAGNTRCWQPNTSTSGSLTGLIFGVTGSVNNQTSGSLGKNNSFEFDGTDDWVVLEDTNIPSGDSAFTVTHWAYWNNPIVQYAPAVVYGTKAASQMVSLNTQVVEFTVCLVLLKTMCLKILTLTLTNKYMVQLIIYLVK